MLYWLTNKFPKIPVRNTIILIITRTISNASTDTYFLYSLYSSGDIQNSLGQSLQLELFAAIKMMEPFVVMVVSITISSIFLATKVRVSMEENWVRSRRWQLPVYDFRWRKLVLLFPKKEENIYTVHTSPQHDKHLL